MGVFKKLTEQADGESLHDSTRMPADKKLGATDEIGKLVEGRLGEVLPPEIDNNEDRFRFYGKKAIDYLEDACDGNDYVFLGDSPNDTDGCQFVERLLTRLKSKKPVFYVQLHHRFQPIIDKFLESLNINDLNPIIEEEKRPEYLTMLRTAARLKIKIVAIDCLLDDEDGDFDELVQKRCEFTSDRIASPGVILVNQFYIDLKNSESIAGRLKKKGKKVVSVAHENHGHSNLTKLLEKLQLPLSSLTEPFAFDLRREVTRAVLEQHLDEAQRLYPIYDQFDAIVYSQPQNEKMRVELPAQEERAPEENPESHAA